MPNYCMNTLTIRSLAPGSLQDFLEKCKGDDIEEVLSLQALDPMPSELEGTDSEKNEPSLIEKYGHSSWYHWRIGNWGTKWDVSDSVLEKIDDTRADIHFSSAWTPPTKWLEKVAPLFPNIKFLLTYREEGCGFEGEAYAFKDDFEDDYRDIIATPVGLFESDDWDDDDDDDDEN